MAMPQGLYVASISSNLGMQLHYCSCLHVPRVGGWLTCCFDPSRAVPLSKVWVKLYKASVCTRTVSLAHAFHIS